MVLKRHEGIEEWRSIDSTCLVSPVRQLWFNDDVEGSGVSMLGGGNLVGGVNNTMQMVVPHLFLGGRRTSAEDFLSLLQVRKRETDIHVPPSMLPLFIFLCVACGIMD